ncbi:pilus assembly protein TadG-related protein [soil metagenome]
MRRFLGSADGQRGQAIVMVAVTMMALLMIVGLAIDAGQLYAARRTMQESADASAYAGAVVLYQLGSQAEARDAAVADATRNGYPTGGNIIVTVNLPPVSGPNAGSARHVEVIITDSVRTAIVPAQSTFSFVRVRGVGGAEPLNNQYALMALDRGNVRDALNISSNGDVHLTCGGILVNSTNTEGVSNRQNDPCRLTIGPAGETVDVAGNTGSSWPTTGCPGPPATPGITVDPSYPQQPDPFAGYPKPLTAGPPAMPVYNAIPAGGTLNPGVWTTSIGGAGNTALTMNAGIYVLKAGINGSGNMSADVVTNGGVFIFNTHSDYPAAYRPGISTCGDVRLTGNGTSNLQPMTTGVYANFLLYQDPLCTNEMSIKGNGDFSASGTIYLPTAPFVFDGNNATLTGSQLIARTIDIQNGNMTIDFTTGNTAQPILPRLTE